MNEKNFVKDDRLKDNKVLNFTFKFLKRRLIFIFSYTCMFSINFFLHIYVILNILSGILNILCKAAYIFVILHYKSHENRHSILLTIICIVFKSCRFDWYFSKMKLFKTWLVLDFFRYVYHHTYVYHIHIRISSRFASYLCYFSKRYFKHFVCSKRLWFCVVNLTKITYNILITIFYT